MRFSFPHIRRIVFGPLITKPLIESESLRLPDSRLTHGNRPGKRPSGFKIKPASPLKNRVRLIQEIAGDRSGRLKRQIYVFVESDYPVSQIKTFEALIFLFRDG